MNPFRCSNCNKLLAMIEGKAEIKCPKCKTLNVTKESMERYMIGKDEKGVEYPIPGARIPVDCIDYKLYPPGVVPAERISRDEIKKRYY